MKVANKICGLSLCIFVCQNISTPSIAVRIGDAEIFDQIDYASISRNSTRCSSTQLLLGKETLLHTWEVRGFLDYVIYLKRFDQIFEMKTDEVSFKSENVDGKWFFKIGKIKTVSGTEMKIVATYSYEARQQKKINFGINLSLIHDNKEFMLPVQKSLTPVMIQQRYFNTRGYSSTLEYAYTFTWPDAQQVFENILKSRTNDSADSGNLTLRFFITAYFPKDPIYSASETCQELVELLEVDELTTISAGFISSSKSTSPPYLRHANSMLHDDRYTDMVLKFGREEIPAHRIILATSSPVFSEIIHNETTKMLVNISKQSTGQIQVVVPDEIGAVGLEEMLRYIYTGKVVSMDQVADQVILPAEMYGLTELKKMCETVLISAIKAENSIEMYKLGKEVNSSKLTRKAFSIMKANKAKVANQSDEFRELTTKYPNLMFELFVS